MKITVSKSRQSLELEKIIKSIFKEANYEIFEVADYREGYDFVAKKEKCYIVEVKMRAGSLLLSAAETLENRTKEYILTNNCNAQPMLIVADRVDENYRVKFNKIFENVILVDISELLFCVSKNESKRNELISCLDYSVDGIVPEKWDLLELSYSDDSSKDLKKQIQTLNAGIEHYQYYEKICVETLTYLFNDVLCPIIPQAKSNKGLYRFDAVARIKSGLKKDFWNIVENNYNTRFLVFEFKNLNEQVNQTQIYTTEKYLYDKALRRVCLLISRKGLDESAKWAAKGCLRENGKLILDLKDDDLIKMLEMKNSGEDPSDYLMGVLEEMLIDLEK